MQGIFLSFYFLRILLFFHPLQSNNTWQLFKFGHFPLSACPLCFQIIQTGRGGKRISVKAWGVHAKVQTRTLWKMGAGKWNTVWPWASIPVNSNSTSSNVSIPVLVKSEASSAPSLKQFLQSSNSETVQTGGFFFSVFPLSFSFPGIGDGWMNCATTQMHGMNLNRIWQWSWRQMAASRVG